MARKKSGGRRKGAAHRASRGHRGKMHGGHDAFSMHPGMHEGKRHRTRARKRSKTRAKRRVSNRSRKR